MCDWQKKWNYLIPNLEWRSNMVLISKSSWSLSVTETLLLLPPDAPFWTCSKVNSGWISVGLGLDRLLMLELSLTLDLETCWSISSESPEEANSLLSFSEKNYDIIKMLIYVMLTFLEKKMIDFEGNECHLISES